MTTVTIDRRLNLVVPIDGDAGTVYAYSVPLQKEVFDRYFMILAKAFAAIYSQGLNVIAGPRIACKLLESLAKDAGVWDDGKTQDGQTVPGVQSGLMSEMWRCTTVLVAADGGGWEPMIYGDAKARGLISADDADELEGVIAFFTLVSAMHKRREVPTILDSLELWGALPTSLTLTEYLNSLPTSTTGAGSTPKGGQSSIPS